MAEYIDIDTPIDVAVYQRNRRIQVTLRQILDSNDAKYQPADVRPVVFCKDCVHFIRGELFGDMVCDYHYLHKYHAEPHEFCSHAKKREES